MDPGRQADRQACNPYDKSLVENLVPSMEYVVWTDAREG
jgi:hypothetical protein